MNWTATSHASGETQGIAPVTVPKLWPGCTMTILGGGPSLTPEDVRYVGERPHLTRVIAIKEAYLLAPWADVLYACDHSWWRYYTGAPTFTGLKYTLEAPYPGVVQLQNTGKAGLELDPSGLRTGHNSGYQAINLAVHLGATRIVLLGFDCWAAPDGRQNWFTTKRPHLNSPYPVFLQSFGTIVEPLKAAGVAVINCSRTTLLRAFPQQALEEVLP
jgi:hypothetical protein